MLNVSLNSQNFEFNPLIVKNIDELVELVKLNLDSDQLISEVSLQGYSMSDSDWRVPLRVHNSSTLKITTTSKSDFVNQRLELSIAYIEVIANKFNLVPPTLEEESAESAGTCLADAPNDLSYFLNWFSTISNVDFSRFASSDSEIKSLIQDIVSSCEKIVSLRSENKWSELNSEIDNSMLPLLVSLSELIEKL